MTVLFSDVTGSTAIGERLDPEYLRGVMSRYFAAAQRAIERHGGTVEKFIGDAVMAVFGIPDLHEDDALRAVRAAIDVREAVRGLSAEVEARHGLPVQVRIGVNTGEVVAGDATVRQQLVTGDAVNVAARLEQAADPDEILIGPLTRHLVRDAVRAEPTPPLLLKGKSEPITAWRLEATSPDAESHARRLDGPMVGRESELEQLRALLAAAVETRSCRLVTIIGAAGIGKSRLVHEFVAGIRGEASVLRGRSLPYGEGITYWPIAQAVRTLAGVRDTDDASAAQARLAELTAELPDGDRIAAAIGGAIGLGGEVVAREEIGWAVRRLLSAQARMRPLVLVIDDVQWAEPTLVDLLESIAMLTVDASILVLCVARPELLDVQPGWAQSVTGSQVLRLEPLAPSAISELVENLTSGDGVEAGLRDRLAQVAEGNPLFLEELIATLVEDGVVRNDHGTLVLATSDAEIRTPPTIQALISARLDRLEPSERSVAQRASVVGRIFQRSAVIDLSPDPERYSVEARLVGLVRREVIRPDTAGLDGDDAFRFRHLLVRDAAYDGLPKSERAALHARFADWVVRTKGERLPEYEEVVGYHLEQAHAYRRELGEDEVALAELAGRAADHLAAAADRAFDRSDLPAAAGLFQRAMAALPPDDHRQVRWGSAWSDALVQLGRIDEARAVADGVARAAAASDDPRGTAWAAVSRLRVDLYAGTFDVARGRAEMERALATFSAADDETGLTHAWLSLAHTRWYELLGQASTDAFEEAFAHARRAGRVSDEVSIAMWLTAAYAWGPIPARDGLDKLDRLEAELRDRRLLGSIARSRGGLLAFLGRFAEGEAELARSRQLFDELAMPYEGAQCGQITYVLAQFSDDLARLVPDIEQACDSLDALGERSLLSTSLGQLAIAYADLGRAEDAERTATRSREIASPDDSATQLLWRTAMGLVASLRGDHDAALQLIEGAFGAARSSDFYPHAADLFVHAGEIRARAGRRDATAMFDAARTCSASKGAPAGIAWVDRREREAARRAAGG